MSASLLTEQQHHHHHPFLSMQTAWFSEDAFDGFPAAHAFELATDPSRSWQYDGSEGSRRSSSHFFNGQSNAIPSPQATSHPHRRALSNSTLASWTSSTSPYAASQNLPGSAASARSFDTPQFYETSFDYASNPTFVKNLPTPSSTPTNDAASVEHNVQPPSSDPNQTQYLGSAFMNQQSWNSMGYSGHNFNQQLPHTPRTASGDDEQQSTYTGDLSGWDDQSLFPAVTLPQAQNDLYTSAPLQAAQGHRLSGSQQMMAYHQSSLINQRLQDARSSASPSSSLDRQNSPFRQGSPYGTPGPQYHQINTPLGATSVPRRQAEAQVPFNQQQPQQQDGSQPKTISPKDAVLDYRPEVQEEAAPPSLFPEQSTVSERSYDEQSFAQMPPNERRVNRSRYAVPTSNFNFVPPSIPTSASRAAYQTEYKAAQVAVSGNGNGNSNNDEPPDYPAHLVHMETSKSEPEFASSQSYDDSEVEKPADTTADAGTYTCTYHGCTKRFRSPADLQRHKREGHRSGAQGQSGSVSGRSSSPSSAAAAAYKNSQAGPHRCDRINPATGKPCSTIFSRPYDLTRHEDTIHNAQKKKVRCHLCTEDKSFSRSDALTRHMRVVHPEVDFPSKHRRRGGGVM